MQFFCLFKSGDKDDFSYNTHKNTYKEEIYAWWDKQTIEIVCNFLNQFVGDNWHSEIIFVIMNFFLLLFSYLKNNKTKTPSNNIRKITKPKYRQTKRNHGKINEIKKCLIEKCKQTTTATKKGQHKLLFFRHKNMNKKKNKEILNTP